VVAVPEAFVNQLLVIRTQKKSFPNHLTKEYFESRCLWRMGDTMRNSLALLILLALSAIVAIPQQTQKTDQPKHAEAPSVWSVLVQDVSTGVAPGTASVAAFTPIRPIRVTRIEALSQRGPLRIDMKSNPPVPCPLQFSLRVSNGFQTQVVPISNNFLKKDSVQTYTDSGLTNVVFPAGTPIMLSVTTPQAGFPPAHCAINGLRVSVQYISAQ
jgi:hypothetical protein